jgi:hypothetical protein
VSRIDRRRRRCLLDGRGDPAAVDARHAEVGDHQRVHTAAGDRGRERVDAGLAAGGRLDRVALGFEHIAQRADQDRVVVDHQDAQLVRRARDNEAAAALRGIQRRREDHAHGGALAGRAVDFEAGAVPLQHAVDRGEAQPRAAQSLGGEEGLDASPAGFLVHAHARVRDLDVHRRLSAGGLGARAQRERAASGMASTALNTRLVNASRSSDLVAQTSGSTGARSLRSSMTMPRCLRQRAPARLGELEHLRDRGGEVELGELRAASRGR